MVVSRGIVSSRGPWRCCVLAAVVLAVGGGGCATPTEDPTSTEPDLGPDDARAIAAGFLATQVEVGARPAWAGAVIDELVPFHDSRGVIQAYEASVVGAGGGPAGWIMVEGWTVLAPVSAFATDGRSNAESLVAQYRDEHGSEPAPGSMLLLWVGPGSAAMDVRAADGTVTRVAPVPALLDAVYDGEQRLTDARARGGLDEERRRARARDAYRAGLVDREVIGAAPVAVARTIEPLGVAVGTGAASFSHYWQERRTWTYSSNALHDCYAGCTPVAFAILFDYWDRNGFPGLISSIQDNSNTTPSDPDVRWTIDELRKHLHTNCEASTHEGSTEQAYLEQGVAYANGRREGTWTARNVRAPDRWTELKREIDAQRPAVIHYDSSHHAGAIDHSAVAYEYTDNTGDLSDFICVAKGWQNTVWECFTPTEAGPGWLITAVTPPPARVTVGNITPSFGQVICATANGQAPRLATALGGGTFQATFDYPRRPVDVDTVFYAGTSCTSGWIRDYWPATNPYAINGTPVTQCVHRPENVTWSYVRGTIQPGGAVANTGIRACPGGAPPPPTTATARVTVSGVTPGAGQTICVAGANLPARPANHVGGTTYDVTVNLASLPASVDVVFYAATTSDCTSGWSRDYWPATNVYAVNGTAVNRCVPRAENPTWSWVRGTVQAGGSVGNTGTRACP